MVTQDGKILFKGKYHEQARYDISNEVIGVVADGCGGLSSYRVAGSAGDRILTFLSLDIALNGERLSPYLPKCVEMIGRTQKVLLDVPNGTLSILTFLSKESNGVFVLIEGQGVIDLSLNCRGAKSATIRDCAYVKGDNFLLSSSAQGEWTAENDCFYASAQDGIRLFFSFSEDEAAHRTAFAAFDRHLEETLAEIREIPLPSSVTTAEEKAMYLSAYFTALENHKTRGEFRAFAAGVNYIDPLRTYFRDSYFTVLPMYREHPELVRDEILTLARGIGEGGVCPSAVKSDFTSFWGDHYDSPSFFVAEIYDYISATGDRSILREKIGGKSILTLVAEVLARLSSRADDSGLLYKEGDYNKRDWADEVNRNGYVTYVEALYYRALVVASRLFREEDTTLAAEYAARAARVKEAINRILFDEEKGYYVNYKTHDFTEDNLSVDTVFTLLFGIAEGERAERVLDNMECLLESGNNAAQGGGDFGVMCVYPPYGVPKAACHKSARLYDYHNGANWCYLTAMYAYAKHLFGRDWRTPLLTTFRYMTSHEHYTPVEYFSPCCPTGSALQGWSAAIAFVWQFIDKENFFQ